MRLRYAMLFLVALSFAIALIAIGSSPREAAAVPVVDPTSCQDADSCMDLGDDAVIGPNSCNAPFACDSLEGTVGEGSCNDDIACHDATGDIGDGSCNIFDACGSLTGTVGDDSCNGDASCHNASSSIGDGSCNGDFNCLGQGTPVDDCEENTVNVPRCNLTLTKDASPTLIPATGGTSVTYTVRIDFLEDESINSIEDDQYPALDPSTDCELFDGDTDLSLGALDLPDDFTSGDYILCEYAYEPPAGTAGDEHVNVVTVNAGDPAADVSAEAAVTYEAVAAEPTSTAIPTATRDFEDEEFPPTATPTASPTMTPTATATATPQPVATEPSSAVGAISPPATGEGGLR